MEDKDKIIDVLLIRMLDTDMQMQQEIMGMCRSRYSERDDGKIKAEAEERFKRVVKMVTTKETAV